MVPRLADILLPLYTLKRFVSDGGGGYVYVVRDLGVFTARPARLKRSPNGVTASTLLSGWGNQKRNREERVGERERISFSKWAAARNIRYYSR